MDRTRTKQPSPGIRTTSGYDTRDSGRPSTSKPYLPYGNKEQLSSGRASANRSGGLGSPSPKSAKMGSVGNGSGVSGAKFPAATSYKGGSPVNQYH